VRNRALAWPAFLVLALALPTARTRDSAAGEPPAAAKPAFDAKRTAAERTANEEKYREIMSQRRERLLHQHLGHWVVIAGGRTLPENEHGRVVPSENLEAALTAATAAVPDARHRFVFRLGEDGDVRTELGGAQKAHVFGNAFMGLLGGPLNFMPDGTVTLVRLGGDSVAISAESPDGLPYVNPAVGPPGGAGSAGTLFVLSTGCSGYGTVPADTAERAGLHLWEIPGVNHVEGAIRTGECRRARMRVRLPAADLDALVPVAVWPAVAVK
jgi:hypothetical protein